MKNRKQENKNQEVKRKKKEGLWENRKQEDKNQSDKRNKKET